MTTGPEELEPFRADLQLAYQYCMRANAAESSSEGGRLRTRAEKIYERVDREIVERRKRKGKSVQAGELGNRHDNHAGRDVQGMAPGTERR